MALDEFERITVVGKGSYGEVWLVRHKKDRKQYVLKKMNLQRASKRERSSAEQEAKLLSKLKHPNIVSYKDSFETVEGSLYIAMQYCEGGDLYTRLKEQKGILLVERQVVEWFVQIAMALQYMHERHILHRDLKTQNIFLTKSKIIKVGDLGIARVLDNCTDMATTLIGTPYYMSPELFSNKPYNHKSDVWALGCCVYEMATLKHAFNAKDMNSLVYKILKGKMPQMPKQYSPELNAIIKSLLHQDPDKRPSVNRILRDPFIKKNIAIFLEDTKKTCRRPSTASRPSSSSSSARPGSASSSRSSESQKPKISVPNVSSDRLLSDRSATDRVDSVSVASVSNVQLVLSSGDGQQVAGQRKGHSRKPSDGAKQMEPIHEDKGRGERMQSSSESTVTSQDTVVAVTVVSKEPEEPQVQEKKERPKRKKFLRNKIKSDQAEASKNKEVPVEVESEPLVKMSSDRSQPVVSSVPRPIPELPKAEESRGLPQKREELVKNQAQKEERSDSSKSSASSSVSSSKEEYPNIDLETPRSLPNISARERRRSRNPAAASLENPNSARIKLVKVPKDSNFDKPRKSSLGEPQKSKQLSKKAMRQPSMQDDSSSEDESVSGSEKEKRRENKEINNFISLLDTTLHLNHKDNKSDEEELVPVDNINNRVNGMAKKSVSDQASDSVTAAYRADCMPSVDTLCDDNRLMNRIRILHTDCIKGVGYEIVRKACHILDNIEEDEIEPQLVDLMGKEKFDEYAGKIWQLKFCEDSLYKV